MDFKNKIDNFSLNYGKIKKEIKKEIANKNVSLGSGGSSNIIIVKNNYVLKIVPTFKNNLLKIKPNNDELESEIYKKLTNEFILENKTPHIVGIYKKYILENIKIALPHKCLSLDQKLMTPLNKRNENIEILCDIKTSYVNNYMEKTGIINVLENCPTTISGELIKLLGKKQKFPVKVHHFNVFIKRVIFQLIYTLGKIHQKYPNFIHNDLFLRNVLAIDVSDYELDDYVQYNHMGIKFYLPANGIYIKINDFGYSLNILNRNSNLVQTIGNDPHNAFEINNPLRDVYTFLFDLYDGPGLGSQSVRKILSDNVKDNKQRNVLLASFRKQLSGFFNYKTIDRINSINAGSLDWLWNISKSKILSDTIKKPNDYFDLNVFDNLKKLPDNYRIVKIYG